jgi:hypothetical protein
MTRQKSINEINFAGIIPTQVEKTAPGSAWMRLIYATV